jgi:hypothetical protein
LSQTGPAKHSPTKFSTYVSIHENWMDKLRAKDFIREDSLQFTFLEAGLLKIEGEISCRGNIAVRVEKTLIVLEDEATDPLVQTILYAYNASVRGHKSFLRYNNLHRLPGHKDDHHKNFFDWKTEEHLPGSPAWVGENGWPTLGEYIEEVEQWYWRHREELPAPDKYGAIDVRG